VRRLVGAVEEKYIRAASLPIPTSGRPALGWPVSTLWIYVRIQLMVFVFVCGIVGPIFLAVYFAAQPEPDLKWMYYTGLVITAVDVVVALTITAGAVEKKRH
jgi:hypothetical protein